MMILVEAELKCGVTQREVVAARKRWVIQGKDQILKRTCRSAQRFIVAGSSPRRVFWLLDTDDLAAAELLADHFGDIWKLTSCGVLPQTVVQAVRR